MLAGIIKYLCGPPRPVKLLKLLILTALKRLAPAARVPGHHFQPVQPGHIGGIYPRVHIYKSLVSALEMSVLNSARKASVVVGVKVVCLADDRRARNHPCR